MLDISFGLMLFTAVVFLLLIFFLNSWLYQPLLEFMEKRERSIQEDLERAQENESGSQKILEEAKAIVQQAKNEASTLKNETVQKVEAQMQELIENKKAELEAKQKAFLQELAKEEQSIKSTLISQMPLFKEALKAKFNQL